jgi:hypothetical protein
MRSQERQKVISFSFDRVSSSPARRIDELVSQRGQPGQPGHRINDPQRRR